MRYLLKKRKIHLTSAPLKPTLPYSLYIKNIKLEMSGILQKAAKIFFSSFDQTALIQGISDIMVVRWDTGHHYSTPFVVCFGHKATTAEKQYVKVYINNTLLTDIKFTLDQYGYLHPMRPCQQILAGLGLRYGRNVIKFELDNAMAIEAEIYLYSEHDKLLVSDMDGTLTKDDIGGFYSNFQDSDYLHDGYYELIEAATRNGYKIVWLTMRSLPLYKFSKQYIRKHTNTNGVLITQPEQLFPALKKQLLKQTGNIKTNMMLAIRNLFPKYSTPFVGGLGNRENDAIAYRAAGIPFENIFIVNPESKVHHLIDASTVVCYKAMSQNLERFFPKLKRKSIVKSLTMELELQGLDDEKKEREKERDLGFFGVFNMKKGRSV